MIVTTEEAAEWAGVSVVTIRRWVAAGDLTPVRPEAKRWLFRYDDVVAAQDRRRSAAWQARHAEAAEKWRSSCNVQPK